MSPVPRRVLWLSEADADLGLAIEFTAITMHAISSADESFPRPCIYMQLEPSADGFGHEGAAAAEDDDDEDGATTFEMRLVPADAEARMLLPQLAPPSVATDCHRALPLLASAGSSSWSWCYALAQWRSSSR